MRPIISPATNTATSANTTMPYRPEPTPPKTTSPSCMSTIGHEAAERRVRVVHRVHRAVRGGGRGDGPRGASPRCRSAPPCPPGCRRLRRKAPRRRRGGESGGVGRDSASAVAAISGTRIADHREQEREPLLPGAQHAARTSCRAPPGSARIARHWSRFESGVGFSSGCAEFALKKPPPFVPSCLIATCEADGPDGDRLLGDRRAVGARHGVEDRGARRGVEGLDDALRHEDHGEDQGERQEHVQRRADEVDPEAADRRRPRGGRTRARARRARPCPVAALTKFCTSSPTIWVR